MSQTGKTILFFIPTHSFATKERVALRDMSIALESGFKVYLATNLQSYLAESASKLGVECFQVGDHFINRLTDYQSLALPLQHCNGKWVQDILKN